MPILRIEGDTVFQILKLYIFWENELFLQNFPKISLKYFTNGYVLIVVIILLIDFIIFLLISFLIIFTHSAWKGSI